MFRHRELGLIQSYLIAATALMTILFWGYYLLLNSLSPSFALTGFSDYFNYYLAITLGFQLSFVSAKQHDVFSMTSGIVESHLFIWGHVVFATAITGLFLVLTRDDLISRFFLFTYLPMTYVTLVIFIRYFAFGMLQKFLHSEAQKLLLIGKPSEIAKVESLLAKAKIFGMETVGILTDYDEEGLTPNVPKLGTPEELEAVLQKENDIRNILILGSPRDRRQLGKWMKIAEASGCRVSLVNDLDEFFQRRITFFRCDNLDLIELREEPLQNLVNRVQKRTLDIVVSLPVVCFVLPALMLLVWVLQRREATGPLFFRQVRSGIDNYPFRILKFRTMFVSNCDTSAQATLQDARVFPSGRWLRRFSLDEFPQFLNVLLGQMSIVGP